MSIQKLAAVGRVISPAAMVIVLTIELTEAMGIAPGSLLYWIVVGGMGCTAAGVEIVGIIAGHNVEGYLRIGDRKRATWAGVILIVYIIAAIWFLWSNPALWPVPIIAALIYISAPLAEALDQAAVRMALAENETAKAEASAAEFDQEQNALNAEHARQMDARRLELEAENDRAIAIAKATAAAQAEQAKAQAKAEQTKANAQARIAKAQAEQAKAQAEHEQSISQQSKAQAEHEQRQANADPIVCEFCGRDDFNAIQGLNAHLRFCKEKQKADEAKAKQNGRPPGEEVKRVAFVK